MTSIRATRQGRPPQFSFFTMQCIAIDLLSNCPFPSKLLIIRFCFSAEMYRRTVKNLLRNVFHFVKVWNFTSIGIWRAYYWSLVRIVRDVQIGYWLNIQSVFFLPDFFSSSPLSSSFFLTPLPISLFPSSILPYFPLSFPLHTPLSFCTVMKEKRRMKDRKLTSHK